MVVTELLDTVNGASSRSTNDNGHYSKISSPSLVKNKSGVMNGKVSLTPPSNKRKKSWSFEGIHLSNGS